MRTELKIFSDKCPAMQSLASNAEQYINEFPDDLRKIMFQSYEADYLMSQEFYDSDMTLDDIINEDYQPKSSGPDVSIGKNVIPVAKTVQELIRTIPALKYRQFRTISHNDIESIRIQEIPEFWIQPIASYIPAESMNIEIIDHEMDVHGYVRTRLDIIKDKYGKPWYFAIYNPDPKLMPDVRHMLKSMILLHYSPEFNHDDIMETGLIPSHGGRTYTYPDSRVFFYVKHPRLDLSNAYMRMLGSIVKKEKSKHRDFSGIMNQYELILDRVPKEVKIYYDPNADDCIYLNTHVEPDWLEYNEYGFLEF